MYYSSGLDMQKGSQNVHLPSSSMSAERCDASIPASSIRAICKVWHTRWTCDFSASRMIIFYNTCSARSKMTKLKQRQAAQAMPYVSRIVSNRSTIRQAARATFTLSHANSHHGVPMAGNPISTAYDCAQRGGGVSGFFRVNKLSH